LDQNRVFALSGARFTLSEKLRKKQIPLLATHILHENVKSMIFEILRCACQERISQGKNDDSQKNEKSKSACQGNENIHF